MSPDDAQPSQNPEAQFEIPEWFQASEDDQIPEEGALGPALGLPDIFDDQTGGDEAPPSPKGSGVPEIAAALQEWQRQAGHDLVIPQGAAPNQGLGSRAGRLEEIAEAMALMARTLRHWQVEGATGAAHILSSLAIELATLAANDSRGLPQGKERRW